MQKTKISQVFRPYLWSYDLAKLDPRKNRDLIIHQVLAFGSMDAVRALYKFYGKNVIRQAFRKPYRGAYSAPVFNLFKTLLGLKHLREEAYVKQISKPALRNSRSK